jgi:hypothetical protein
MSSVIQGSAAANASILYIGEAFGVVACDGSGDYSITVVNHGEYILSAYAVGLSFAPSTIVVEVSGTNVTGQDFTPTALTVSSPLDSRVSPNLDRVIQAAQIFDVEGRLSSSPPLDCRAGGAPVDSRVSPPLNSRT